MIMRRLEYSEHKNYKMNARELFPTAAHAKTMDEVKKDKEDEEEEEEVKDLTSCFVM